MYQLTKVIKWLIYCSWYNKNIKGGVLMLIKKERLKENNEEYEILYFGKDEDNISATVKRPVQNDIDTEPEQEDAVETDEILAEMLLNQTNMKAKQEEQDEVLAMLLVNSRQKGE